MTFTLIQNGEIKLTARTHGTWSVSGRVDYTGDKSLLSRAPLESAACYLGGYFSEAAQKHRMQTGGDYMTHRTFGVLVDQ
jgi:hypothetical protein